MKNNYKACCFVTNLSIAKEPTIKNRLVPYINQAIKQGLKVTLVTTDSEVFSDIDSHSFTHVLFPYDSNRPKAFVSRAISEWIETRRLLRGLKNLNTGDIFLTIPSMFLLFNAPLLRHKTMHLDVRDLTWEYLLDKNPVQRIVKVFFRMMANRAFRVFSSIVVTNESEAIFFKKLGINTSTYSNGVTYKQFKKLSNLPKKESKQFTITYVGKVGIAQNLETLIGVAETMSDIAFNIVGYGSEFTRMQDIVSSKSLKNVSFHNNADWEKVLYFYQESDVLYAQLRENFSSAMPSKLYQYINAGKFVVYGGCGQAAKTLAKFSHNIVVQPEDSEQLELALRSAQRACEQQLDFSGNIKQIKDSYIREKNAREVLKNCL